MRILTDSGGVRWLHVIGRAEPGRHGTPSHVSSVSIDITRTKETEAALRAAHDTFSHFVDHSPFGIYVVDSDFRLVRHSDGARAVFEGISPLIGRDFAEILRTIWTEPFASRAIDIFWQTLRTGEPHRAPSTIEQRGNVERVEAYDWKTERIVLPDGRFGVVCHFYDLSERMRFESHIRFLMNEVNHRSKNLLSVVLAIARQTARTGASDFLVRFERRLWSLSASQDLLLGHSGEGVWLHELVKSQLAHFGVQSQGRIHVEGPDTWVDANAAQPLGMALHELGANASKYGALSNEAGRVEIAWGVEVEGGAAQFVMSWTEHDGPSVLRPGEIGFGTRVLRDMTAQSLRGRVDLQFAPQGLSWRLVCPAGSVINSATGGSGAVERTEPLNGPGDAR